MADKVDLFVISPEANYIDERMQDYKSRKAQRGSMKPRVKVHDSVWVRFTDMCDMLRVDPHEQAEEVIIAFMEQQVKDWKRSDVGDDLVLEEKE